jgi:hypothetical protein
MQTPARTTKGSGASHEWRTTKLSASQQDTQPAKIPTQSATTVRMSYPGTMIADAGLTPRSCRLIMSASSTI